MAGWQRISEPPEGGWRYLIALGSNRRHRRFGAPEGVLTGALAALVNAGMVVERSSPFTRSLPMGPSRRRYANGASVVRSDLPPDALLAVLKAVEVAFGRRGGQRWGGRVLDLDIVLWSGGRWRSGSRAVTGRDAGVQRWRGALEVPHKAFRARDFVLGPSASVAPLWRDPVSGLTLRQLMVRQLTVRQLAARQRTARA